MKQDEFRSGDLQAMDPLVRLEDDAMERMLRGERRPASGSRFTAGKPWKQLVLESACACLYDVLSGGSRTGRDAQLEMAVIRRWNRRYERFHSPEHYLLTREAVVGRMSDYVERLAGAVPIVLFETFVHYLPELDMEVKQTFHLVLQEETDQGGMAVHKLIVDESPEALELYAHMTTVYFRALYGVMPSRIEAVSLLTGNVYQWRPDEADWQTSVDYLQVIKSMLAAPDGIAH
ncbi:hypothetical protein [Paenibacillus xanthanilyticus]|uniref:TetR/AcrR family transcriptional regulator n=1 Tax=Paenibacillus xanthanilyticus TaxID=1783531 RepID=A0ABV8KE79_9BACL